jgi:hypothetical protein
MKTKDATAMIKSSTWNLFQLRKDHVEDALVGLSIADRQSSNQKKWLFSRWLKRACHYAL